MSLNGASSSVTPSSIDVLSNKTIDGEQNTLINIPASALKTSDILIDLGQPQTDHSKLASAKEIQDQLNSKPSLVDTRAEAIKYALIFG